MIGNYCKEFRKSTNSKLLDITIDTNVKAISAFESGRSSNIKHLERYFILAIKVNECERFVNGLIEVIKEGDKGLTKQGNELNV